MEDAKVLHDLRRARAKIAGAKGGRISKRGAKKEGKE